MLDTSNNTLINAGNFYKTKTGFLQIQYIVMEFKSLSIESVPIVKHCKFGFNKLNVF